jgi:protein SCO1/2
MLRQTVNAVSKLASTTTRTQSSKLSTMVQSKLPTSTLHRQSTSPFTTQPQTNPFSRRHFSTVPEQPQQPMKPPTMASQEFTAQAPQEADAAAALARQQQIDKLKQVEHDMKTVNLSGLDETMLQNELRFPGYSKFMADKLEFEALAPQRAQYYAELESTGQKDLAAKLRQQDIELKLRHDKLTDTTFADPVTGVGFTPAEKQKVYLDSQAQVHEKLQQEYQESRKKFFDDMKQSGIHTSRLARLFNSKEDLIFAQSPARANPVQRQDHNMQPRSFRALTMIAVFSLAAIAALKVNETQQIATAKVVQYQTNGTIDVGDDFSGLIDHRGKEFSTYDYRGFYPLYYFGFTKCPDICPTELHKMMAALDQIEENKPEIYRYIKPIFVSVDALRDTPAQIAAYAENFHPRLLWVTGAHEQLAQAAKGFRIYFSIPDDATPDGEYNVDHSVFFFLMDRDGKLLSYYGQNKTADEIALAMSEVVAEDLQRADLEQAVGNKKQKM